jgi:hypothetical protein
MFLSDDGRCVDYAQMVGSPEFAAYVQTTAQLQQADLGSLDRAERTAFFLNCYNVLIVHVTAAVRPAAERRRSTLADRRHDGSAGCRRGCVSDCVCSRPWRTTSAACGLRWTTWSTACCVVGRSRCTCDLWF